MTSESDIIVRLHLFEESERGQFSRSRIPAGVDGFSARQVARVRDQLVRIIPNKKSTINNQDELTRKLVLLAYPDRVCRRRNDIRTATMVGGIGVKLDQECSVLSGDFFVSVDPRQDDRSRIREAFVRIASRIEPDWLEQMMPQSITRSQQATYDTDRDQVIVKNQIRYLDLPLRESIETNLKGLDSSAILARALKPMAAEMIQQNENLQLLISRIQFLNHHLPDEGFPQVSEQFVDELLIDACQGKQSRRQVEHALYDAIRNRLHYPLDRILEAHAPEAIEVPTGSQIRLNYQTDPSKPPVLAVRLQELFGLAETPRIAKGRASVLLHLLGPNYRPVQVTQDLASFWKNTYAQVRKDLRAQYPKHSWPDDPLSAPPVRGAKRRRP